MSNPILSNYNNRLLEVRGVIQAGMGGESNEINTWREYKIPNQIYIEPYPQHFDSCVKVASPLSDKVKCFQIALSDVDGEQDFYICNQNDSHSLSNLSATRHHSTQWMKMESTIRVKSMKLDTLIETNNINMDDFNLLFLDTQCTEHRILKGAQKYMKYFDFICIEVPYTDVYEGSLIGENFNKLMLDYGYIVEIMSPLYGDGVAIAYDTLYTKRERMPWYIM